MTNLYNTAPRNHDSELQVVSLGPSCGYDAQVHESDNKEHKEEWRAHSLRGIVLLRSAPLSPHTCWSSWLPVPAGGIQNGTVPTWLNCFVLLCHHSFKLSAVSWFNPQLSNARYQYTGLNTRASLYVQRDPFCRVRHAELVTSEDVRVIGRNVRTGCRNAARTGGAVCAAWGRSERLDRLAAPGGKDTKWLLLPLVSQSVEWPAVKMKSQSSLKPVRTTDIVFLIDERAGN